METWKSNVRYEVTVNDDLTDIFDGNETTVKLKGGHLIVTDNKDDMEIAAYAPGNWQRYRYVDVPRLKGSYHGLNAMLGLE